MRLNGCFCVFFCVFFTSVNCDETNKVSPVTTDENTVKGMNETELTTTEQQMAVTTDNTLSATKTKTTKVSGMTLATEKMTKVIEHSSLFRSNVLNISSTNSLFSTRFVQIRMQPHKLPDQLLKLILVKCTFRVVHAAVINQATHHPAIQTLYRSVLIPVIPSHRAMRYNLVIHLRQAAINLKAMDILRNTKTMLLNTIGLISMRGAYGSNLMQNNFEHIFFRKLICLFTGKIR